MSKKNSLLSAWNSFPVYCFRRLLLFMMIPKYLHLFVDSSLVTCCPVILMCHLKSFLVSCFPCVYVQSIVSCCAYLIRSRTNMNFAPVLCIYIFWNLIALRSASTLGHFCFGDAPAAADIFFSIMLWFPSFIIISKVKTNLQTWMIPTRWLCCASASLLLIVSTSKNKKR